MATGGGYRPTKRTSCSSRAKNDLIWSLEINRSISRSDSLLSLIQIHEADALYFGNQIQDLLPALEHFGTDRETNSTPIEQKNQKRRFAFLATGIAGLRRSHSKPATLHASIKRWRQILYRTILSPYSVLKGRPVRYTTQVKPISFLKANAAEVLLHLAEQREPMVITQNGEAKAVIQDVASYEETQETLALLKILALGNQEIEAGKVKPVGDVVARLRAKSGA